MGSHVEAVAALDRTRCIAVEYPPFFGPMSCDGEDIELRLNRQGRFGKQPFREPAGAGVVSGRGEAETPKPVGKFGSETRPQRHWRYSVSAFAVDHREFGPQPFTPGGLWARQRDS